MESKARSSILKDLACIDRKEDGALWQAGTRVCLGSSDGTPWRRRRLDAALNEAVCRIASYEGWRSVVALIDHLAALFDNGQSLEIHWFDQTAFPMFAPVLNEVWKDGPVLHFCDGEQIRLPRDR